MSVHTLTNVSFNGRPPTLERVENEEETKTQKAIDKLITNPDGSPTSSLTSYLSDEDQEPQSSETPPPRRFDDPTTIQIMKPLHPHDVKHLNIMLQKFGQGYLDILLNT